MYDPVSGGLLAQLLPHQGVLIAEQLHGKLVVRRLKKRYDLVFEEMARRVSGGRLCL